MSTSTTRSSENPKAPLAAGKRETIKISLVLKDKNGRMICQPNTEVKVDLIFDVVEMDGDNAVVVLSEFALDRAKRINIRLHMGSILFGSTDYRILRDIFRIDLNDNMQAFVDAFRPIGYRLSSPKEFEVWHEFHVMNYKKDALEPAQKYVNGGLSDEKNPRRKFPMLEAGYADMFTKTMADPDVTYLEDEIDLIITERSDPNQTAMLLHRI